MVNKFVGILAACSQTSLSVSMPRFMGETPRKLADYHETLGITDADLAPALRRVRANAEVSVGKESEKDMRNAAVVPLVEEVFANLHAHIQAFPETIGLYTSAGESETPEALRQETYVLLDQILSDVCTKHTREKSAAFRTLSEYFLVGGMDDMIPFMPVRIQAGLRNANTLSWRMMEAVPKVFRAERGQDITAVEYEALCQRNIELLTDLSRLHLQAFGLLMSYTKGADRQSPFETKELSLAQGRLQISEELLANVFGESSGYFADVKTPATGCPALFAHSPDGHGNVIHYLHHWHMQLARKHIFPRWGKNAQDSVSPEE